MYLKIVSELGKIDELPTIPAIILKLNSVLANPDSSAKDVATLIEQDQVLTTRVLKLVNAAFYGYSRRITTLTQAVVIVGFRDIRNIVLASKTFDLFKSCFKKVSKVFDVSLLWKHSLGCAAISKKIGEMIKYPDLEALFIAGLIHDIGKVVEMKCLFDYIPQIFEIINTRNTSISEAEQEVLNLTHAEIGKVLVDMWDFPSMLEYVVAYHHKPFLAKEFAKETSIVHIANSLSAEMQIGSGGDNIVLPIYPQAWTVAGIDETEKDNIKNLVEAELPTILSVFSN